jgi:hypothetical protein
VFNFLRVIADDGQPGAYAALMRVAPLAEEAAVRPVVDPVPIYAFSVVWRPDRPSGALTRAVGAIRELSDELDWLELPKRLWWVPPEDR